MTRLPDRFVEDRALRDSARKVLNADIEHLRGSLAEQGIASRVSSGVTSTIGTRIRTGARDAIAEAKAQAAEHKGVLGVVMAAILLFLARGPILEWIEDLLASDIDDEDDTIPDDADEPQVLSEGDLA